LHVEQLKSKLVVTTVVLLMAISVVTAGMQWVGLIRMHYLSYDYAFFYYAFHQISLHVHSFSALYNRQQEITFFKMLKYPIDVNNQFVYPPQFAVLFSWLGLLPFRVSALLWMLVSLMAYFSGLYFLVRLLWGRVQRSALVAVMVIGLGMMPFETDLVVGNVNSLLFFLIVLSFYLFYQQRYFRLAALSLGLAILIKVTPAAILLVFVLRGQWRMVLWTAFWVLAATVVTAGIIGISPIWQYAVHFSAMGHTSMKNGAAPYNQSIMGVVGLLQVHHYIADTKWLRNAAYGLFILLVIGGIYAGAVRGNRLDWALDMGLASLCPLLFSPLIEQMHLLLVFPAIAVLIKRAHGLWHCPTTRKKSFIPAITALISLCLVSLPGIFLVNDVSAHWPVLFWLRGQMFIVLASVFGAIVLLYRRSRLEAMAVPL